MRTIPHQSWIRASLCAGLAACGVLACAHAGPTLRSEARAFAAGEPRSPGAEEAAPVEPAKPDAGPADASACGGPIASPPPPDFRWPARGAVTSDFGERGSRPHQGIDISGYKGRAVRAAADGQVIFSERKRGYGRVIILEHAGGYRTLYAHNQDNLVWKGLRVKRGQVIADMGSSGRSSGPHLHFEVRVEGRPVDPLGCLPSHRAPRR